MKKLLLLLSLITSVAQADDYTLTINDKSLIVGVTLAREFYNASLLTNEKGELVGEIKDDTAYLQMVMENAARGYSKQYNTDIAKIDNDILELQAKKVEILSKAK